MEQAANIQQGIPARRQGLSLPTLRTAPVPKADLWRVAARLLRWTTAGTRMALRLLQDRRKGPLTNAQIGARLRTLFEEVGGTGIKLGQQLAVRADLLPFEICEALALLMDKVPPFPVEVAARRLEAITGRPLHETFTQIDPRAIGSASVACVFQGVLRTGERVAIKMQRPGVAQSFGADLEAFHWATRFLEVTTLVREGMFAGLRKEIKAMFLEELDFVAEARYQRLFRKFVRRDNMKGFDAPKVYDTLCADDLLVTELVDGVAVIDILAAVERKDERALAELRAMDIDPDILGERLWAISNWGKFEAPFYHADPHPGNMIAQPGSHLILLDFGACGFTSDRTFFSYFELMNRLIVDDFAGVTDVALAVLMPLPYLEVDDLRNRFSATFFDFVSGVKDPAAEWWQRTTAGVWIGFLKVAREKGIPVNLDTVRLARSTLLYDTLAARLNSRLTLTVWTGYRREHQRRAARRTFRRSLNALTRQPRNTTLGTAEAWLDEFDRYRFGLEALIRARTPDRRERLTKRIWDLARVGLLNITGFAIGLGGISTAVALSQVGLHREAFPGAFQDALAHVILHPVVLILLAGASILTLRRLSQRLQEVND